MFKKKNAANAVILIKNNVLQAIVKEQEIPQKYNKYSVMFWL